LTMRFIGCLLALLCSLVLAHAGGYRKGEKPEVKKEKGLTYTGASAQPSPVRAIEDLPASFDWGDVNGRSYLTPSWNQHLNQYCGSCWIHGTLSSMNDRIKIARGGRGQDIMLARQVLLNCGKHHGLGGGCGGGDSFDGLEYMHRYGLPDETCQVYSAKESDTCDDFAVCHNCMPVDGEFKCWPVKEFTKYYVTEYGRVSGEAAMMSEIFARGPISCGFATTDHFDYKYKGGVYVDKTNQTADNINHDVEVVGWGVTADGVKYWRARNSWGAYWGEDGFFKIIRGVNNMAFETDCAFGIPDVRDAVRMDWGEVVGGMYGLRPKPYKRQVESGDYIITGESDDEEDRDEEIKEEKQEQAEKQQKATEKKMGQPHSGTRHVLGDKLSASQNKNGDDKDKDNDPVTAPASPSSSSSSAARATAEVKQQFIADQLQQIHLEQQQQQERLDRTEQARHAQEYQQPPTEAVQAAASAASSTTTPSETPAKQEEEIDSFDEDEQDEQYAQHHPHYVAAQTQEKESSSIGLWIVGGGLVMGAAAYLFYRRSDRHSYEPIGAV